MSEKRIVKEYTLSDKMLLKIPGNPRLLHVALVEGESILRALVDPENEETTLLVRRVFTGRLIERKSIEKLDYIGTTKISRTQAHWFIGLKEDTQEVK